MDISLYLVRKQWILGAQSKTSSYFVLHGLVCTHPSTAANLPCLPGSSVYAESLLLSSRLSITRVSAPLQGHALWNIFLPTTGSFFVCCITDFFPVTAPSGGRFPVTFHLLLNSSYHGQSQPSSSLSEGLRPAMIHCFFLFMLLAVFLVLRCHSASSDHHNPHLWLVSYKISGSAYMPPLSLTASFSVDFSPLSGNNYGSL